ncbi:CHASE3 domain-containing protein [Lysobacter auxotrophicus]|uniref:histidine kinase n=1 Tax=Lysobacter auxotrophicus TaxID=2992573 RepID=A0ABM8DD92_9GAMM|nr:CHASE3 domain-containing protein [Lysobacter auxotrophicus]BDU16561.1 CHASE3 domain-containing protein [Lysobacter auxotrophicus]
MGKPRIRVHNIGFGLALLVILLLLAQARRTQEDLLRSNQAFARSAEVLTVLQDTLSALQDVETGMRGYVITGTESFLEPYREGTRRLALERSRLRQLIGNQRNSAWWARADRAIDERVRLAEVNVELRRHDGLEAATQSVAQAGGKEAMDRVRALLGELEAAERERLYLEGRAVERRVAAFRQWTMWGTAVALALLVAALVSVHRSVTQRRQALRLARAGESRQRAILEAIPDLLWQFDAQGNPRLLSSDYGATLPPALLIAIRNALPDVRSDTAVRTLTAQEASGQIFEARLVAIDDGHLAIVREVTEFIVQERALRDQHDFLRAIVDADESLVCVRSAGGRFTLCNIAFAATMDLTPSQVEGRRPSDLAGHRIIEPLLHADDALLQGEDEWRADRVRIVDARDRERWMQVLKRPLVRSDGQRQVLTVVVDVSAQQRMERMKDEFISTISHELRTPLTSIRGALGLVVGGAGTELPDSLRPLLEIAHKNTERLVRLINDILDIEKLQWGGLPLQSHRLPLRALVAQSVDQIAAYAREFEVAVEFRPGDDGVVEVDVDRFAQVMANLLSNAIKHSHAGGTVEVSVTRREGGLQVDVQDHGEGIPESFRPRVFERFAQADASDVRRRGGSGLGLAITQSLVEKMAGRIGFDTVTGEGTRFFVWLPEAMRLNDAAHDEVADDLTPYVVLLQDEAAMADELGRVLGERGYRTLIATDIAQARGLLESPNAKALAIDLASAGTSARGVLRELRSQPRFRSLPVLLLGIRPPSVDSDGLRGGAVGVVDWLGKPLDPELVADTVRSTLRDPSRRFDVLHVEDDEDVRELLRNLLDGHGVDLHAAGSLAQAREQLGQRRHDLVILDLMLPDGDGSELLAELAQARPPTPVIIFSAQDGGLAESRAVLRRLVKSRHHARDLATLILETLRHWPAGDAQQEETG